MNMNRTDTKRTIDLKSAQKALRDLRQKIEKISENVSQPITAFLTGGTLLGRDFSGVPGRTKKVIRVLN